LAFPTPAPPTNQRSDVIHEVFKTMNVFAIVSSIPHTQIKQEENQPFQATCQIDAHPKSISS
jgi:hypothetical protein